MRKTKFILWLAVLALFALPLSAQNSTAVNQVGEYWEARHSFTATGWSAPIPVEGRGITNHRVNWVGIGTVSTCVGTLETSPNGFTWTTLITVADCSSNGVSAVTEASTDYIRMRLTTLTGGGTLRVYYLGMPLTGSTVTLAAETTKVIGTVNQGTSPWVVGDGAGALNTIVDSITAGDNNIGNVDVVTLPALVAGTAAIGKLAANSGVDIGDVDVTSLPALATGTNAIGTVQPGNTQNTTAWLVQSPCPTGSVDEQTTAITTTAETSIADLVASERHHITAIDITASTAVSFTATLKDSVAGATRAVWHIKDASNGFVKGNGSGIILRQKAAQNNSWTLTLSASSVTVAVNVTFCKDTS